MSLKEVIENDCKHYESLLDGKEYIYLNECANSKDNHLYQLIFNGRELWYGTLQEINAVVKSMCYLREVNPW